MSAQLNKSINKITVLSTDEQPGMTIYKKPDRKKKKGTFGLQILEKMVRRTAKSDVVALETYLKHHNRSNRKKRDGWLIDLGYNTYKAQLKKIKRLTNI